MGINVVKQKTFIKKWCQRVSKMRYE